VITVGKDNTNSEAWIPIQLAIGESELSKHRQVSGVSFIGAIEADKEDVIFALEGDPRGFCGHAETLTSRSKRRMDD
jgi:hypothetical protein